MPAFPYTDAGAREAAARPSWREDARWSKPASSRITSKSAEKEAARGADARVPAQPGVWAGDGGGGDLPVVAVSYQSEMDLSAGVVAAVRQGSEGVTGRTRDRVDGARVRKRDTVESRQRCRWS